MHPCIAPLAWAVRHVMPLGPSVPLLAPQRYSCRKPWNSDLVSAFGSEFRDSLSKFLDTWVSQLVCQGAVRCRGIFGILSCPKRGCIGPVCGSAQWQRRLRLISRGPSWCIVGCSRAAESFIACGPHSIGLHVSGRIRAYMLWSLRALLRARTLCKHQPPSSKNVKPQTGFALTLYRSTNRSPSIDHILPKRKDL